MRWDALTLALWIMRGTMTLASIAMIVAMLAEMYAGLWDGAAVSALIAAAWVWSADRAWMTKL
jgi:hypothetical protein